jgi:hypothetical protein
MFTSCQIAFGLLLLQGASMLAQELTVRFRSEKEDYQVGEPVFLLLDVVNAGLQSVRVSDGVCWTSVQLDLPGASAPWGVSLYGCAGTGTAGSCLSGARDLRPGEHLKRRFLVERASRIDSARIYSVHVEHTTNIYAPDGFAMLESRQTVTDVDVVVREGTRERLAEAYQPLVQQARSSDPAVRQLALAAITQNPPAFLESLLLELADDPRDAGAVIPGLARLGTRATKDKLAELAGPKNPESLTQPAIQALAELGDRAYCPVMLDFAERSPGYSRMIALRGAGYLCGEKTIPLVVRLLNSPDQSLRYELAYALGNTQARDAVPILIDFLPDKDENVRRAAADALTTLTHRSQEAGIANVEAAAQARRAWMAWWSRYGRDSKIYGPEDCAKYLAGQ